MLLETIVCLSVLQSVSESHDSVGMTWGNGRGLASAQPAGYGVADDVRREGFGNGRLHVGHVILGNTRSELEAPAQSDWSARNYGTFSDGSERVYVRVHGQVLGVDPWTPIEGRQFSGLEAARVEWLKERNLLGGVRTMVNDAAISRKAEQPRVEATAKPRRAIEPRGIIQLRDEGTKLKSRMEVRVYRADQPKVASR
jgi:hypothetical protein